MIKKTEVLIKNLDWRKNPTQFEYKEEENSQPKFATAKTVKEFGIYNTSKYVGTNINIDRSSNNITNLSHDKNPIFQEEELFLKVLVEGNSNLYEYVDNNVTRYFYNKENSDIEQLIYKKYKFSENNIGENNRFRQQLWKDVKCSNSKMDVIEKLNYTKKDLLKYFVDVNKCDQQEYVNFEEKQERDVFNFTIRPRVNSSSLAIVNSYFKKNDFENKINFGLGVEAEFILPFNKNKWAIAIEPTYQSYNAEARTNVSDVAGGEVIATVDYSSIEIPVGLRHYLFLNDNSKMFINASYIFDFSSNSYIELNRNDGSYINSLEIKTNNNFAMGVGFKQNDRYSLELRYHAGREVLGNYLYWNSDFKSISLIFGYSLF
ncbi:PorT family protein [Weeksellaceae bacterium KMM 9713]|uniref:PorT family protein n=1 Tax=Profundicola chukchiensis TaxID=2961959 RepID=A0A9X4MZK0_9FLAO|nr:tRNA modification GTPase [Profundicola chukchiensis]MDG4945857.1 PorT family protein [Profundicola chukchiensis]